MLTLIMTFKQQLVLIGIVIDNEKREILIIDSQDFNALTLRLLHLVYYIDNPY